MRISSECVNHGCVIQLTNEKKHDRPAENREIYQNVISGSILGISYRISCGNMRILGEIQSITKNVVLQIGCKLFLRSQTYDTFLSEVC